MKELIKVIAKIELYSGDGMRKKPFTKGYRPLFDFVGEKTKISGRIDLINMDEFFPGMSGIVQITFIKDMINAKHFLMDEIFSFSEGQYSLGSGKIVEVIN